MGTKEILIVSRSFHPMNSPRSFRTTELVKEFARKGHNVTLYTLKNNKEHTSFEQKYNVTIKDLGALKYPTFSITGGRLKNLFGRAMNRCLNLLFEYPNIELMGKVKHALKKEKGYDLLISIATPHPIHWGIAAVSKKNPALCKIWVADCGDPYMGNTLDTFNKLYYFKFFEKLFCKRADYITVPVEEAKNGYYDEFREKIRVIPQGFNFDEVEIDGEGHSPNPIPTFAYAGGLIPGGRDPGPFLEYLVGLDRDYKCIFYTRSVDMVQPYVNRSGGRIEIRDYIPRTELLEILSKMDFLVNVENNTEMMAPSKLIDYHLAGRPVLSVQSGEVNLDQVNQFLSGDYSQQRRIEDVDQYRIENVCTQFLELCHT